MTIAEHATIAMPRSLRAIIPDIGGGADPTAAAFATRLVQDAADALEVQARRIAMLERLACSDEATGLLNRRGLAGALSGEMDRAKLAGTTMAVLLIAVRGLADLPTRIGRREAGDITRVIAESLRRLFAAPARLARIGADDFAAILPGATLHEASARGEHIGTLIGRIAEELPGISARAHAIPVWPDDRPADVLRRLDEAEQFAPA